MRISSARWRQRLRGGLRGLRPRSGAGSRLANRARRGRWAPFSCGRSPSCSPRRRRRSRTGTRCWPSRDARDRPRGALRRRSRPLRRRLRRLRSAGPGAPRPARDRARARGRRAGRRARRGDGTGPAAGGARAALVACERRRRLGGDARARPRAPAGGGGAIPPRGDRGAAVPRRELRPRDRHGSARVRRRPRGRPGRARPRRQAGRTRDREPAELVERVRGRAPALPLPARASGRTHHPAPSSPSRPDDGARTAARSRRAEADGAPADELSAAAVPPPRASRLRGPVRGRRGAATAMRRLLVAVVLTAVVVAPAAARVGSVSGTIVTVAGTGTTGISGDGGPATAAAVEHPRGLAVLRDGSVVVAEPFDNVVRRLAADGTISTVAGTGAAGFKGDGGAASLARLDFVHGVAAMPDGGFVLADTLNERIRRVLPDGRIGTVAGSGVRGYAGDGGAATAAAFEDPRGVATFPDGRILIPDTGNDRIRLVRLDGTIETVAGDGVSGFAGDGGPATAAELRTPFGVAPLPDGGFLVDDSGNARIRRVWPDGHISTVAGNGVAGYSGDGGPAVDAELRGVHNLVAAPGGFLIADTGNDRVRLVRDGTIETVAGSGANGFSGDGGPATAAALDQPKAVALTKEGSILIADAANHRVP